MNEQRMIAAPAINPETTPFWQAAIEGRFILPKCSACGRTHWYPRVVCPFCFGDSSQWIEASGRGTIYSFTFFQSAPQPYIVAYVTLEEGPTMLTNIVDSNFDEIAIGQAVKLVFKPSDGGQPVPMFTRSKGARHLV
jgi:uncharacterized OB-fold protein